LAPSWQTPGVDPHGWANSNDRQIGGSGTPKVPIGPANGPHLPPACCTAPRPRMRNRRPRAILSGMNGPGHDRRKSATANAVLLLVSALIPVLGTIDTSGIDHTEVRPWGCRTCTIPTPPPPVQGSQPL
jgi:hypothetical protein